MCESFFAALECELLDRYVLRTHAEARMHVFKYIEGFYKPEAEAFLARRSLPNQVRIQALA